MSDKSLNLFEVVVKVIECVCWRYGKNQSHIGLWLLTPTQSHKICLGCFDANYNVILTTNK